MMAKLHEDVEADIRSMVVAMHGTAGAAFTKWSEMGARMTRTQVVAGLQGLGLELSEFQCLHFAKKMDPERRGIDLQSFIDVCGPPRPKGKQRSCPSSLRGSPQGSRANSARASPHQSRSPSPPVRNPKSKPAPKPGVGGAALPPRPRPTRQASTVTASRKVSRSPSPPKARHPERPLIRRSTLH